MLSLLLEIYSINSLIRIIRIVCLGSIISRLLRFSRGILIKTDCDSTYKMNNVYNSKSYRV